MKLVINNQFGGFGLSPLGLQEWAKRKGKECYFFKYDYKAKRTVPLTLEQAAGELMWNAYSVPNPEDYKLNERGEDGTFKDANARATEIGLSCLRIPRDDADLIAVVEELGEKANGACAKLRIVEIPDDVAWEIEEYDGNEWVSENHRRWS